MARLNIKIDFINNDEMPLPSRKPGLVYEINILFIWILEIKLTYYEENKKK